MTGETKRSGILGPGSSEDGDGDGDGGADDGEDDGVSSTLREPEALLSRPTGTDAAAFRLSETISVKFPEEGTVH